MADKDLAFDRKVAKRHQAMNALSQWLTERDVDGPLRTHVHAIDNHLGTFDDREARRFALNRMELGFRDGDRPWDRSGRRALALWRLHQQLIDSEIP